MRVAIIAVLLVVTTPSEASKSCMTSAEARQHFGSRHIYWHGKDHCWSATPTHRHHHIHEVQKKNHIHNVEKRIDELKVHDEIEVHDELEVNDELKAHRVMSAMVLDEGPVPTSWVDRWVDIQQPQAPIVARQVDIVQAAPPTVTEREPMVTSRGVVMVIISIAVSLAIVDVLFGDVIYRRPVRRWPQ
jgi:hypothetical protein